jgi:hypothetical protein
LHSIQSDVFLSLTSLLNSLKLIDFFIMPSSDQQQQQQQHHSFHHDFISTPSPLFPSNLHKSILTISPEQIHLSTSTIITLAWNIHDNVITSNDTIGIFCPGK